ncbi:sperm flagellar protein 2 [Neodiprion pinetum]|uniref:sperm flagellar protein 2 n=1 Tax=Neodiprion pinetum TaxID=441929 RepID=UPI001EE12608|nr:sperm flagellar protein 2-like [Neodiprion pinetum]
MSEVLKTWFQNRLGIMIDLHPDVFGLITRDGTLLAQLLHSYDIIDNAQISTIHSTEDPALARVNLKLLRVWLKFIGVDCDDDTIEEISNGQGTTATRLFYKIFVSLEGKDKLHFITQQKEREKFIPQSSKFDVSTVPDKSPPPVCSENPLAGQLVSNASVIAWHRDKFQAILNRCILARKLCVSKQQQVRSTEKILTENIMEKESEVHMDYIRPFPEQEIQELHNFSCQHKVRSPEKYTYHELCNEKKLGEAMEPAPADPEAAKTYVKCMKDRTRRASQSYRCKNQMEKSLTAKLWEKQVANQETEFDLAVAKKLFSQSQYEKQMMTKLCEIRDQKQRIAKNRGIVNKLMEERMRTEHNIELAREHEVAVREGQDIEAECSRLCELHRRIHERKIQNCYERNYLICNDVLNDLIDIAVQAAIYRESNDNFIPAKIWGEWKALFIKSQPIFSSIENIEYLCEENPEDEVEDIFRAEIERQEVLNDADFDNYLNVSAPWDEFMPDIDLETEEILRLGIIVLGYIVHRLLDSVYPPESKPEPASVPKVSSACILLGVLDTSVYPTIQSLLNHRGIKLIFMEDAINYCLRCFKDEMKDFSCIDLSAITSKNEVSSKTALNNPTSRGNKNTTLKKKATPMGPSKTTEMTTRIVDKQTQTPRVIPNEDMSPDLSNSAYIGKWVYQFLTLGQPLSNELNTKILIEYMKSLNDIEGWVLIDYPNTFDQMAQLETALTGIKIPQDKKISDDLDGDIDELNQVPSRITYEDENLGEFSRSCRESRLVYNPIPNVRRESLSSYMTAYIRALPKPKNMHIREEDIFEILSEDTTPLDAFYTTQGIAYAVYYTSFDLFTLKRLCRLAIGDMSIPRVPSIELFGEALDSLEDEEANPPLSKTPIVKQFVPCPEPVNDDWGGESDYEGEGANYLNNTISTVTVEPTPSKPGEDGWEWIKFPQAPLLLEALANLWENMETVYIEDLKEIFFIKRVQYSHIVPYRNYVTKHMTDFIQRPDSKQDLLHKFHTSYNDIAMDMRDDLDVKCELHCRVADFQKALWEICDERRKQAEEERQRIIRLDWTAEEMVVLANLYICMIEAEVDRYIDTVQLLQDYYTSMLQRPISENRLAKLPLQRLEIISNELMISSSTVSLVKAKKPAAKETASSKTGKNVASQIPHKAPIIDCTRIKKQIAELLISAEETPHLTGEIICYQAVHANIMYARNVVDSQALSLLESLKKEQTSFTPDAKGRIQMAKNQLLPTVDAELMAELLKRGPDLYCEWRSALQFEINRILLRLKLLENAALSDISFLYETMQRCFSNVMTATNDRYNREIKSVNEMASVFSLAIEEEIPIQEELLLDEDRFIVRSSVLMYPDEPTPPPEPIREAKLPSQFRMGQLGRLMDIFRYVAPHGSLPQRFFTYILEDIVACGEDEGVISHLPSLWSQLRPCDVPYLVTEIFGDTEYVDWREFIIYVMDISMPSDEDILDMRLQFIAMDPTLSEMVTRDQFHSIKYWFTNCDLKDPACKNLLHEDYQRNEEEMYEEEREYAKIEKTCGLILPKTPSESKRSLYSNDSTVDSTFPASSRNITPQETVRLMLAKELLCEMFVSGCTNVNYTAFLLAFCKDYDPREGFGKALTLVLGDKICVSEKEGEEFVAELLEQQRLAAEEMAMRNDQWEAAEKNVSNVISDVLKNTLELTEGITISEVDNLDDHSDRIESTASQQKRNTSIEYTNSVSPGNSRLLPPNVVLSTPYPFPPPGSKASDEYVSDQEISRSTILAEGYSKESLGIIGKPVVIHWIPREACQAVLLATLPWHARQPDILGTTSCLRDCLDKVYADLLDTEIRNEQDYVLSHRLVNHGFITNLLSSTSTFTMKNIGNILRDLLNKKYNLKQTTNC